MKKILKTVYIFLFIISIVLLQLSATKRKPNIKRQKIKQEQDVQLIQVIPEEILLKILFFVPPSSPLSDFFRSLIQIYATCKKWNRLVQDKIFQKNLFLHLMLTCSNKEFKKILNTVLDIIKERSVNVPCFLSSDALVKAILKNLPSRVENNSDPKICLLTLKLLKELVKNNNESDKLAIQITSKAIIHKDIIVRNKAFNLFKILFDKKYDDLYQLALEIVVNNISHKKTKYRMMALALLQIVIIRGYKPDPKIIKKSREQNEHHANSAVRLAVLYLNKLISERNLNLNI